MILSKSHMEISQIPFEKMSLKTNPCTKAPCETKSLKTRMTCLLWTRTHPSQCWKVWTQDPLVWRFESLLGTAHMGLLDDETLGDSVVIPTQERFEVRSVAVSIGPWVWLMSVKPRVGMTAPVDDGGPHRMAPSLSGCAAFRSDHVLGPEGWPQAGPG